ncbi:MAG: hypothetical protein ACRDY0_03610 [Acidimicrobiales bacterium]
MVDTILPAELFGMAHAPARLLAIGDLKVSVRSGQLAAHIRQLASDLSIAAVELAAHHGPGQEELDLHNEQAQRYPQGANG